MTKKPRRRLPDRFATSCCVLFTGHAIMRNHYGGLLMAGPSGGEILPANAFQDLHLKNVELIVLSAVQPQE